MADAHDGHGSRRFACRVGPLAASRPRFAAECARWDPDVMNTHQRQLWFWLAAFAALLAGVAIFRDILLPFVAGMVLAYFLNPLADRLEERGLSRTSAALVIVGVAALVTIAAMLFLLPVIADQIRQFVVALPDTVARLKTMFEALARDRLGAHFPALQSALDRAMTDLPSAWGGSIGSIASALWSRGMALVNILSLLLVTPLVMFYMLVDWHPMLARVGQWLPRDQAPTVQRLAGDINDAVAAFIRGQGTICMVLGCFYAVGLSLAGVNYGALVGLSTGALTFIPMVGWALGLVTALGLALAQFGVAPVMLAKVAGVMIAGQALDTALLSPRFVGQKIGLHPVWLIFALFAFSYLFGFVGTLLAVPVAAAIGVLVRHALSLYLDSSVYRGDTSAASKLGSGAP
jgi:predicted PurR-regulated permease PerM